MPDRRCPYCNELVPSTSITCPKCYKRIPTEPQTAQEERQEDAGHGDAGRRFNRKVGLLLNLVPGIFGILGLGQIYRDPRGKTGYIFLLLGLLLFGSAMLILLSFFPILSALVAFPLLILYVLLYIGAAADILLGFVLHMRRDYRS